jgi:hypothetical protein
LLSPERSLSFAFGSMANSNIIASMLRIVDDYEASRLSPEDVQKSLGSHMQALEGVELTSIHTMRGFTHRLVSAHIVDDEMEFKDDERVQTVLAEMRSFLHALPA